jgi:hypothetical protein
MGMTVLGDRKRVMLAIKKVMGTSTLAKGTSFGELSEMLDSSFEEKSPRSSVRKLCMCQCDAELNSKESVASRHV